MKKKTPEIEIEAPVETPMAVEVEAAPVPDIGDVIDDLAKIQGDLVKIKKAAIAGPPKSIKELHEKVEAKNKFTPEE